MKKNIYKLLIFLYVVLLSCQQDKNEVTKIDPTKVSADVISKLQQAGYDTSQGLLKYKDGYLVEYDIFFTEEQINDLTNPTSVSKNGRVEHYRSNNLVTGTPRTLKVYIDPVFGSNMLNACNTALARYNALYLGLVFQSVATAAGADISISSFYEVTTVMGYGSYPSGGNPGNIRLNSYYYNASSTPPSAAGTIAHEIGHAIGFRHTDYMNISFSCGGAGGNTGGEAVYIPGTPSGPSANSFMLACTDGIDRPFTAEDVTALRTVYPLSTIRTIQSKNFANVFLRLDGAGVTSSASGGGTVNCQYTNGPYEQFYFLRQSDGTYTITSVNFPNVYLRMDGAGVTSNANGGGKVNCQYTAGPYEKFNVVKQSDGTYTIGSVAFPNVYLRMDGAGVTAPSASGGGSVNCQYTAGLYEKFSISPGL